MNHSRTRAIVFLTVFLDLVGFGIIIPIQPFFAEFLGASPATVTLLGASYSLMQFLFAPFWGRLSDKVGRRPIMLVSTGVAAAGYFSFALAETLPTLFLARMLSGFGTANIGTAQAIMADITPAEGRARGMGLIGAAFGLGFIFGPAMGGALGQISFSAPALVAGCLCALNFIFACFMLPETYPREARLLRGNSPRRGFSWEAIRHAARHSNVGRLFLLYLLFTSAFSLMEQVLGLFIEHTWLPKGGPGHSGRAAALTTYALMVVGVTATIIQGGLIGRLARVFGERRLLVVGTLLVGVSFLGITVAGHVGLYGVLLLVCSLMAVGAGLTNPSMSSLLSRAVDADEQGGVLGLGQSIASLGRVIGPSVAGSLFQISRGLPFWVGAGIMLGCSFIAASVRVPSESH